MAKVLLVEPDKTLAKQYQGTLTKAGHEVAVTQNGHQAISLLDETSFDIMILELQLGQHNGIELLYELRSYDDLSRLPVIILSSIDPSDIIDLPAYKLLDIAMFLYKPHIKLNALADKINTVLEEYDPRPKVT